MISSTFESTSSLVGLNALSLTALVELNVDVELN